MLERILMKLGEFILSWLLKKVFGEIRDANRRKQEDARRKEINEENLARLERARTKAERISAAKDLLNGVNSSSN